MNNYVKSSIHSSKQTQNKWYLIPDNVKNTASVLNNYSRIRDDFSEIHGKQYFYYGSISDEKLEFSDYDSYIAGETGLEKDWMLPQEDIAWKDL